MQRTSKHSYDSLFIVLDYIIWDLTYCYYLLGGIAQGVQYTAIITDLLCFPIWVIIIPELNTRALWQ
jgi:hypothetical protein